MPEKPAGTLYLLPVPLAEDGLDALCPTGIGLLAELRLFGVESEKAARRVVVAARKRLGTWDGDLTGYAFLPLEPDQNFKRLLDALTNGQDVGVVSDAGCPGIADPGQRLARLAHEKGFRVRPVPGPNSMILALMASGLNGQQFSFHGYLPRPEGERRKLLQRLEQEARRSGATQLFMDTPYRNTQVVEAALAVLHPDTLFCLAANLTAEDEVIISQPVGWWKRHKPEVPRVPAVFLMGG